MNMTERTIHTSGKPAFLIDLDGTMYAGRRPIPGARPFIDMLRNAGVPYLYLTNNSSRTPEAVAAHLREMGVPAEAGEVVTSSQAAARYIADAKRGNRVYMIGEEGLERSLREAGLELVDERPDFVVQGIDRDFSYRKLDDAVRHILAGAVYVLTNPDRLLPGDDRLMPGAGAISGAIQAATQVKPVTIGKPFAPIVRFALQRLNHGGEVWVVGDNLSTDIEAGRAAGLKTALVLTGIVTPDDADRAIRESGIRPDLVAADLPGLAERLGIGPMV